MSVADAEATLHPILQLAIDDARERGLPFAGEVTPEEAWGLMRAGVATLVDVRTEEEWKFVGHVPGSELVPWATGIGMMRNPRFERELEARVGKDDVVLLLCRSAKRSAFAAEVATKAGFAQAFNVLEGFEGDLDGLRQRRTRNGWCFRGLPWVQD